MLGPLPFFRPPSRQLSNLWLPSAPIFPPPKRLGLPIVHDPVGLRIEHQSMACAVRNIPQVTEHRALVALLDVRIRTLPLADAVQEIPMMRRVAAGPAALADLLVFGVENSVIRSIEENGSV